MAPVNTGSCICEMARQSILEALENMAGQKKYKTWLLLENSTLHT